MAMTHPISRDALLRVNNAIQVIIAEIKDIRTQHPDLDPTISHIVSSLWVIVTELDDAIGGDTS